jgi:hypothetical protein
LNPPDLNPPDLRDDPCDLFWLCCFGAAEIRSIEVLLIG